MEFLQLSGPLLDVFLFFSKTKIFHSHPCVCDLRGRKRWTEVCWFNFVQTLFNLHMQACWSFAEEKLYMICTPANKFADSSADPSISKYSCVLMCLLSHFSYSELHCFQLGETRRQMLVLGQTRPSSSWVLLCWFQAMMPNLTLKLVRLMFSLLFLTVHFRDKNWSTVRPHCRKSYVLEGGGILKSFCSVCVDSV